MKTTLLLLSVLTLMTVRVIAADTNLNQSITVARPLDNVIGAMQTYYYSTNYHGFASAVHSTNAVPEISYTLGLWDCAFHRSVGVLDAEMVATRITASATKLEMVVKTPAPQDSNTVTSLKQTISKTLERVAKIAESKQ